MDDLWKALGHTEQHILTTKLLADIQYHYFNALREAGFDEDQCVTIFGITMSSIGQAVGIFMSHAPRPPRPPD